jgi:hypothetical protein
VRCRNWSEARHMTAQLCDEMADSTGSAVGVSSTPEILRGSAYTNSATDASRSALNDVRMPRRTRGGASLHCWSASCTMAAFSVRWKRSTSPVAADGGRLSRKVEFRTIWPGNGRVVTQTEIPGRWWWFEGNRSGISFQSVGRLPRWRL